MDLYNLIVAAVFFAVLIWIVNYVVGRLNQQIAYIVDVLLVLIFVVKYLLPWLGTSLH